MSPRTKLLNDQSTRLFDWRLATAEADLPATTKHVALVLSLHMNRAGESCFPGIPLLQRQTSLSRSTVQDHLRALASLQWLERRLRPGRGHSTEYVAMFPPKLVQEIIEKARSAGLSEEAPDKGPENARKRPAQPDVLSIEDGRTGGREDVKTPSTNVLGAAPRVEKGRVVNTPDDLSDGQLMGLVRTHLYVPDGKPPAGENGARCVSVIQALRKVRQSGYDIAAAIEGLALLRERGELNWLPAGTKCTMRALFNTRTGVRPVMMLAQETYHKHASRRRDDEKTGLASIGDTLRRMVG